MNSSCGILPTWEKGEEEEVTRNGFLTDEKKEKRVAGLLFIYLFIWNETTFLHVYVTCIIEQRAGKTFDENKFETACICSESRLISEFLIYLHLSA